MIYFFFQHYATLAERKRLKAFLEKIFKLEGRPLESLNYIFCSDKYLLEINQKFLQHDYYTDIISFELSDPILEPAVGEIYISIPRIRENAVLHQISFKQELHRVIFHGALHLCGYKDKKKKDQVIMRSMEDHYLKLYGIGVGN